MKRIGFLIAALILSIGFANAQRGNNFINAKRVSADKFGNDRQWYIQNIPFFECSDKKIEGVYYYRWKLYKAHLKNLGANGYIITEFLNTMGWDKKPYNSLNDATGFHMYEGRWLKDTRYVSDYINFMYQKGGNDRHFSEAIADAAYACYLVTPDKEFITSQLASMVSIYNKWNDHFDPAKGLYYIEPLLDATEYTISSIDASNGKDGFRGGDSFRPSINSFMYANALAIKNIALLKNDTATARVFAQNAVNIKNEVQKSLWNDQMNHFIDRYKVTNPYVKYWDYIRGRELVGFVPWTYNLPDDKQNYNAAWQHILSPNELKGEYGLRTNEPSYQYYMKQYRYDKPTGLRECQWNGPSWPFQTSQVLLGMANLLNNYQHHNITAKDYFNALKQYTLQHYTKDGGFNLYEDYDPDKGGPVVDLPQRSEHYNHSEYNDLIITGLCGLRPMAGDSVVINPLISKNDIKYLCLQNVSYHGHNLSIVYDETGQQYHQGKGLSVYIDENEVIKNSTLKKQVLKFPNAVIKTVATPIDMAANSSGRGFPKVTASYTDSAVKVNMANDGRVWYFNDVVNYWSPKGSNNTTDWYQVEFDKPTSVQQLALYFYADDKTFAAPKGYKVEYLDGSDWKEVPKKTAKPIANTKNELSFNPVSTTKVKVTFEQADKSHYTALAEMEVF